MKFRLATCEGHTCWFDPRAVVAIVPLFHVPHDHQLPGVHRPQPTLIGSRVTVGPQVFDITALPDVVAAEIRAATGRELLDCAHHDATEPIRAA